ncbi:aspartyl-phosphate phosphatase Spo0E family protein [Bacillus sp. FJAT-49736]|uniref:aspartyl-phosphate phosphatase Spo0E family protein n=1 Tax=Bacillus sp. FJAT-49736 TaxID=2833582 RepID=UPI0032D5A844
MYSDTVIENSYLYQIQKKREEMIDLGKCYGLTDKKTVACSQQLDELLNKYQYLMQEGNNQGSNGIVKEMSFILYCKSGQSISRRQLKRML